MAHLPLALPHRQSGKVRVLAVTSGKRIAAAPDLPTAAESGAPGYEYYVWYGLLAPAGTPAAIVARLNGEIRKITNDAETRQKFSGDGLDTLNSSPEAFAAYLTNEVAKWEKVVKAAGIRAQ